MSTPVRAEIRGDVCVVRCRPQGGRRPGARARRRACALPHRRRARRRRRPRAPICLSATRPSPCSASAARAFHADGGEFVVACEDRATARGAGRGRASPAAVPRRRPGPAFEGVEHVALPDRPRWQHQFSFPAVDHELPNARRRDRRLRRDLRHGRRASSSSFTSPSARLSPTRSATGRRAAPTTTSRCASSATRTKSRSRSATTGRAWTRRRICAPGPTQPGGRGIHFMRTLADDMLFACGPTGTRVLLVKKLR